MDESQPSPKEQFDELASKTQQRFKEFGIQPKDIEEAVRQARKTPPPAAPG